MLLLVYCLLWTIWVILLVELLLRLFQPLFWTCWALIQGGFFDFTILGSCYSAPLGAYVYWTIWSLLLPEFGLFGVFQPFTWTRWIYLPSFMVGRLFFDFTIFIVSIGQDWIIPLFDFCFLGFSKLLLWTCWSFLQGAFFAIKFFWFMLFLLLFGSIVSTGQSGDHLPEFRRPGVFQPFTRTCWVYLPSFIFARLLL